MEKKIKKQEEEIPEDVKKDMEKEFGELFDEKDLKLTRTDMEIDTNFEEED